MSEGLLGTGLRSFSTTPSSTSDRTSGSSQNNYFSAAFSDSASSPSDDAQWESLIDRGYAYGIKTRAQLCQEADVGHTSDIGTRLTDEDRYRNDPELWEILLIAQALRNGHEGIKAIWRGMKFRGEAVRLDRGDPRMEPLYKTFLSAGGGDHPFLWAICKEMKHLHYKRQSLFAEVVGAALEGSEPLEAIQFASFIGPKHYRGQEDLLKVFNAACQSSYPNALEGFRRVYSGVPASHIYDEITASLWEEDRAADAFAMHSFLVRRHDLPTQFKSLEPFISHMASQNQHLDAFLLPLSTAGVSFQSQAKRLWSMSRSRHTGVPADSLNIVASRTLGATPKKLSDQFVARAFATRAFSFDFAIQSLRMIGLIEVGPLAVRQLAMASSDLATIRTRFQTLRKLEIDTGATAFVRVLKNTVDAGQWEMVQALLDNDLHHEAFENTSLQKQLLSEYYRRRDWRQLNRTLTVLNDGRFDDWAKRRAANHILMAAANAGEWSSVVDRATFLQGDMNKISPALPAVLTQLLRVSEHPTFSHRHLMCDIPVFVIGMIQKTVASGTTVELSSWRHAIRGLGRQGRLEELEPLLYWIAEWFRHDERDKMSRDRSSPEEGYGARQLFDDKFQKSLMSWCFRPHQGMLEVSAERCLRWTRMLKKLRDNYGVEVKEYIIRWEYIKRLRRLFASGMRLKRPNQMMRQRNRVSLLRYWALYDKMWDMRPLSVKYDRIEACLVRPRLTRLKRRKLRDHWSSVQVARRATTRQVLWARALQNPWAHMLC